MRSATPYPCVEVDWLDSQSEGRWRNLPDALRAADEDDLIHHSCGYLVVDTDRYLVIVGSFRDARIDEPEMVADLMQIPRPAVVAVRVLLPSRPVSASEPAPARPRPARRRRAGAAT